MFTVEPHTYIDEDIMIKLCFKKKYVKSTHQIVIFKQNPYSIKSYIEPHIIFMLNQLNKRKRDQPGQIKQKIG